MTGEQTPTLLEEHPAPHPPDVESFFDAEARHYEAAYDHALLGYAPRVRMKAFLDRLGDGPGDVLDVGMGPGHLCHALAARGWTVTGVDASGGMVALARTRLRDSPVMLLQARVEKLPFRDHSFDAVAAAGVLEYADDVRAAVNEISRVLRPGGAALLSLPNATSLYELRRHLTRPALRLVKRALGSVRPGPHRRRFPPRPARFEQLLLDAGLEVTSREYAGFLVGATPLELLLPRTTVRLARRLEHGSKRSGPVLACQVLFEAHKR